MTQVNGDPEKAKTGGALLLTAPGVPFIYYGEEIGMTGQKPDEKIRTPMQWDSSPGGGFTTGTPWQPLPAEAAKNPVAGQSPDPDSLLSTYRKLVNWRMQNSALRSGAAWPVECDNSSVYALLRSTSEQAVLVIINMGSEAVSGYQLSLASGPLQGTFSTVQSLDLGTPFPALVANPAGGFDTYGQDIPLLPYQTLLLNLQP